MAIKAVVVTGASSGIGEATTRHLAGLGFLVMAGVRRDEDAARLKAIAPSAVRPVILDVTSPADIALLREETDGLADTALRGLVNNAGVATVGPVEMLDVEEWRRQLEVNLLGQVAVTRALLPALLRSRGRVVNISSLSGLVSPPLFGPYSASKFALEAFTDTLRRELAGTGVNVVAIEPGAIATPIWGKSLAAAEERMAQVSPAVTRRYAPLAAAVRTMAERGQSAGLPPKAVAEVVARALTAPRALHRRRAGRRNRPPRLPFPRHGSQLPILGGLQARSHQPPRSRPRRPHPRLDLTLALHT